jgi:hypothetical protein
MEGTTTMKPAFPWKNTFLLGFGSLGISIIWPIFNQFIPLFLQAAIPNSNGNCWPRANPPDIVRLAWRRASPCSS